MLPRSERLRDGSSAADGMTMAELAFGKDPTICRLARELLVDQ
jgi:hypothetical protein